MAKEVKTNAVRILDREKIPYQLNLYDCKEFIDGVHVADMLSQPYECSFKTLVARGKTGGYYVYCLPIKEELDLKKCAKAVGEKSVELIHVKEINSITGYIRGGCTPIGMKKRYPTVLHESALKYPQIIISAGRIGAQIFMNPNDLVRVTGAKTFDIVLKN